jgi:hypothetical protein
LWLNHNVNEQLDVHQANPLCHRLQKTKKKEQQQLTPGRNGKIEEKISWTVTPAKTLHRFY